MNAEVDSVLSNGIVEVGEGVGVAVGAGVDWTGRVGTCAVDSSDGTGLERRMALG